MSHSGLKNKNRIIYAYNGVISNGDLLFWALLIKYFKNKYKNICIKDYRAVYLLKQITIIHGRNIWFNIRRRVQVR